MIPFAKMLAARCLEVKGEGERIEARIVSVDFLRRPSRIPKTIVCQKHVDSCTKTLPFGHLSGRSYRRVQSRWKCRPLEGNSYGDMTEAMENARIVTAH